MRKYNLFRKVNILMILLLPVMMLTGCKNSFDHMPDLTDEERTIIAQYAADILIKHDKNNGKLVSDYEIQLYDEKEAQKKENLDALLAMKQTDEASSDSYADGEDSYSEGGDSEEYVKVYTPVAQVLGTDSFSIDYNNFYITDSYSDGMSDDSFFALDASNGNKLLVVEFLATNITSVDQELDIFDNNVKFKIGANDESPRLSMSTMLLNDMSMYRDTIPANSSKTLVLLREVPEMESTQITNVNIEAVKDGITYYIQ